MGEEGSRPELPQAGTPPGAVIGRKKLMEIVIEKTKKHEERKRGGRRPEHQLSGRIREGKRKEMRGLIKRSKKQETDEHKGLKKRGGQGLPLNLWKKKKINRRRKEL